MIKLTHPTVDRARVSTIFEFLAFIAIQTMTTDQKGILIHFRSPTKIIYRANKKLGTFQKIKYFKIIGIKKN